MPTYTTGELAKLCGVTVRTVQYYDTRGVLIPSGLSEGGRRLYSEEDLRRMKIICFLREAGLPLSSIGDLLAEQDPGSVIGLLLEQQEASLRKEVAERQEKLDRLAQIRSNLREIEHFSVDSIGDIARIVESKAQLRRTRAILLATGVPFGIMEWSAIFLWIFQGIWWPFALYTLLMIPYVLWTVGFYHRRVSYLCPRCHAVFKPGRREMFFARHTFATRKLTCPCCGHKGFCIETVGEPDRKDEKA